MNPSDYYKHEARTVAVAMRRRQMTRLEALERKYKTMNIDEMTLVELKQARGNMRGWMEMALMDKTCDPQRIDAVERKLKQVETEIAWRERGEK